MQKTNYILSFIILSWFFLLSSAFSKDPADFQIASSPNPVGSGARAIGMGGAFIGVADDATAAFWNPGGLVQLKKPEISGVGNWFHRIEDNTFWEYPESNGSQSVTSEDINYLSIVYPFNIYDRSMVISLNYQHLYDFTREWNYSVTHINQGDANMLNTIRNIDYQQDGMLSAVGLAYCVQITRNISFGFTLNIWDDNISSNTWDQNIHLTEIHKINSDIMLSSEYITRQKYSFSGFNSNIGMLWNVNDKLSIGLVCKTPFKADLSHEIIRESIQADGSEANSRELKEEELDMPMSYGLGAAYRFSDIFTVSGDVYKTHWEDFIARDSEGNESSLLTSKPVNESDIDSIYQVRVGTEYLFKNIEKRYVIPLRAGIFYDPAPAEGNPDDYYGFSIGSGIAFGRCVFDIAYQHRFANNADSLIPTQYPKLSHDVDEHMIYSSLIIHF